MSHESLEKGALMVCALDSGSSGPGLSPVVILGKTIDCDSASLQPGVQMVIGEFIGSNLATD